MDDLKKLQLAEMEMLQTFDQICHDYDLPYFVLFGTALGTERHQGFIPWDDDIDVGMLRADFEKLKKVPIGAWNGFELITPEQNCFYHEKLFPRIYKPGTVLEFEQWKKYVYNPDNIKKPVWIDIFLFDYVDSKKEAQKKAKAAHRLNMRYYYSRYLTNVVPCDPLREKLRSIVKRGMHYLFSALHTSDYYLGKYYQLVRKEKGKYMISFDSWRLNTIMDTFGKTGMYFPVRRMNFENFQVCVPNDIRGFLTQRFGDYMVLPSIEQQKSHTPCSIDLGE